MFGTLLLIILIPVAYVVGKKGLTIDTTQFKDIKPEDLPKKLNALVDGWIKKLLNK